MVKKILLHLYILASYGFDIVRCNLTCYNCNLEDDRNCIHFDKTLVPSKFCMENEKYCNVKRLEQNGKVTYFKRLCSKECLSECIKIDSNIASINMCYSCCSHNLCNIDNSANNLSSYIIFIFLFIFYILFYM
ncbi:unnamed protein product [Gordionus sp. m RMFG-2023]